jgi:site-specific recombinase
MESYELQQNTYAVEEQNRLLTQQAAELAAQNELSQKDFELRRQVMMIEHPELRPIIEQQMHEEAEATARRKRHDFIGSLVGVVILGLMIGYGLAWLLNSGLI